jgi:AraC-like DNA-binding protein
MASYDGTKVQWEDRHSCTDDVVIGRVLYEVGGSCGPRTQRDYQLVVMHSGDATVTVDKTKHSLAAGHVYLLTPGHREYFTFSRDRGTHHSWCSVNPGRMPDDMAQSLQKAPRDVPCSEIMDRLLSVVFDIDPASGHCAAALIESFAITLFHEYLHVADTRSQSPRNDPVIARAISYMEWHFADEDCLAGCHAHAGISRNVLTKRFGELLQVTPAKYLWRLRTEKGIAMLYDTGLTISEIAYRCGFKNPYHFSRKVKELHGQSPRDMRRSHWGDG